MREKCFRYFYFILFYFIFFFGGGGGFFFFFVGGGGGDYFCGSLGKSQKSYKLEPAKISCHTVSLVYLNVFCFVDSLFLYLRKTIRKIVPFVGEKLQCIWIFFFNRVGTGYFLKINSQQEKPVCRCVVNAVRPFFTISQF